MKINNLLNTAFKRLKKMKIPSAALDAEVLLSFVLKKPKEFLFTHPEKTITAKQLKQFNSLIKRRVGQGPVAYLTQKKEFFGLEFYVDQRVLIPRPETEILVEEILKTVPKNSRISIVDIGTGSGCIAITLAKHLPQVRISASDISQGALAVAKKNAKKHGVFHKIRFLKGDLLEPLSQPQDLIVANLPYLSSKDRNKGIKYEPSLALFSRKQGLEYLTRLLAQATSKLSPKGKIFLEIQPTQLKQIKAAALANFPSAKIKAVKDLTGRYRVLKIYTRISR